MNHRSRNITEMKNFRMTMWLTGCLLMASTAHGVAGERKIFNHDWLLSLDSTTWKAVSLPHAWNEDEAFRVSIEQQSDTVAWYQKRFCLHPDTTKKYFIELEGARFAAEAWLNGHRLGMNENGVMAFGFDMTPFLREGDNVLMVRTDNSWHYHERATGSTFQWNNSNFNANYGGLPKNVWMHVTDRLHLTLPLYSSLGTTGTYVYGSDYDIAAHTMTLNVESQVVNEDTQGRRFHHSVDVFDAEGHLAGHFDGDDVTLQPGTTTTVSLSVPMKDVHFWDWGYGYLYTVRSNLEGFDTATVVTGFRKTAFHDGMIFLNDRPMTVHGYAQRTSNEWPAVGMSVPTWLSDYSNRLMVEGNANMVRWMHVTPWKQDVESCDRVGLPEAMPAGDAEKDIEGRRWEQRVELMRDAIVYNRNNPSILFYEGGNESISREHMKQLRSLRDQYDPHGGRAIGSREMLDINEAEYGGEMLYVNKSATKPLWMMEYCRDEGLRKYWDNYSYPYHQEGAGPLYRGKPATEYNHNQDMLAVEMVRRWYDYWLERYGTGRRVNAGGVKIVFSDTNTHHRGEANYRTSGVVDAMRIPKDSYYTNQVMWNGMTTPERQQTYIIGHWNYEPSVTKPVYVVSTADSVRLYLNGKDLGWGTASHRYLHTFNDVAYEPGTLKAVGYHHGKAVSEHEVSTVGAPDHLNLTLMTNPNGMKADGADMALLQVEVVDKQGHRCPLDNHMLHFTLEGEGEWRGGIATGRTDNYILSDSLPVECGVNRVLIRSTRHPGTIRVCVQTDGLAQEVMEWPTVKASDTPETFTFQPVRQPDPQVVSMDNASHSRSDVAIIGTKAGSNDIDAAKSHDDNELSEWRSDGRKENAWIRYHLERKAKVSEVVLKLTGWRSKCYPLAIYEGKHLVWKGMTYATLGYVHIPIDKPRRADNLTIRMLGPTTDSDTFGDTKELAGGKANELDRLSAAKGKVELRIVEVELKQRKE